MRVPVSIDRTLDSSAAPAVFDALLIQLGDELFALPSNSVREVLRYRAYTPVPGAPPMLPGILNQRGVIMPVVNIYSLLGITAPSITRSTRLILMNHNDIDIAVLAEVVLDLVSINTDTIEPLPIALDPARARFLRGMTQSGQRPVALFDLDELITGLRAQE